MMKLVSVVLVALGSISSASAYSTPAAYGVGKPAFNDYRATLPADYNVVAEGGWHALQQKYVSEVGKSKLSKTQLPTDLDVVRVGGYDNLAKLAADPKAELVTLITNNLRSTQGSGDYQVNDDGKMDALVALLQSFGKGFSSVAVDGEWKAVLARQGKKSTISQKFVGKKQKSSSSLSNFNVKAMLFENLVSTRRGNGLLKAVVKYKPVAKGFTKLDGKIVLRRISCDIEKATFKYWKLPTVSIPFLKRKGGYLDFLYLDEDIRITKGNKGGLFVHFRPEFYEKTMGSN